MDDELKVVVTSVIEADEEASAQRIIAQLPAIAKKINASSSIKVGVDLDSGSIGQAQANLAKRVAATKIDPVELTFKVSGDAKKMLREAMSGLGVKEDSDLMRAMTSNLTNMEVQVGRVHAQWSKVGKEKERLLNLEFQTHDGFGKTVSILQQYDKDGRKVSETIKNVSLDLDSLRAKSEAEARKAQADNDARLNYYQQQRDALAKLQAQMESAKSGLHGENLAEAQSQYQAISDSLNNILVKSGAISEEEKRGVDSAINALQLLIQTRREEESVADAAAKKELANNEARIAALERYKTQLADLQANYLGKTGVKGITDESNLAKLNAEYQRMSEILKGIESETGVLSASQRASIDGQIADFKRLVKEMQNAEYVATRLRAKNVEAVKADQIANVDKFEQKLRSAGILTDDFQAEISALRTQIDAAFDGNTITAFLNKFDNVKNQADATMERLSQLNKLWGELSSKSGEVTRIQKELVGLDPQRDAQRIEQLNAQLAVLQEQELAIGEQIRSYGELNTLANGRAEYEQRAKILAGELAIAEAAVADDAAKVDVAMQAIPTTIDSIRVRFLQLTNPTQELIDRMGQLDERMKAVGDAKTDEAKLAAWRELLETITFCRKEVQNLSVAQRGDVIDVKFASGLEKAKSDLETIARTWSAFKHDNGLKKQFDDLSYSLQRVKNQTDLTKWTAQFNAFKSSVKAAGKNVQSLGDIFKTNLGKVMQWVSATTLLFRAFRLLKSAISTVTELDTAMVDLRKVTNATDAEYKEFYHTANNVAKSLNATTEAVISQTAEWARLGYSMQDAAKLAENSMIFSAVSPGMSQEKATDGLVSIIKAYDIDVEDTLDGIISKVNEVGNKFAVSNEDIVDALTKSSSAMAAANNTFEETVALATAAIEITRDADTVGNALKTLSMRIRGYDEETEEYSEDVAVLTGKVADFTKTASNPTGVSLFTDATMQEYRSTYDILSDIADIWEEISDVDQARLLENLFGKRQSQVGSAILKNFDQARSAIEKMEDSAGSAGREMEKVKDSIAYSLNELKQTWVGVAQNLFDQEHIKVSISVLTTLSGLIDSLTSKLGLFGTVTLAGLIGWIVKIKNTVGEPKNDGFHCAHIYPGGDTERACSEIVLHARGYWQNRRIWQKCCEFGLFSHGKPKGNPQASSFYDETLQRV